MTQNFVAQIKMDKNISVNHRMRETNQRYQRSILKSKKVYYFTYPTSLLLTFFRESNYLLYICTYFIKQYI